MRPSRRAPVLTLAMLARTANIASIAPKMAERAASVSEIVWNSASEAGKKEKPNKKSTDEKPIIHGFSGCSNRRDGVHMRCPRL